MRIQKLGRFAAIQIGSDSLIEIDKFFGPLVLMPIRVKIDTQSCEWVIERCDAGSNWREVARIPGQLESDFQDPIEAETP